MPKNGEYVEFKTFERKLKITIYDLCKILKSAMRTNIKNMLLLIMAIKQYVLIISLVSLLGLYLGKDVVYSFINSMIKESKYCNDLMEKKNL